MRRGALAGFSALALAVAGVLAATVTAGVRPLAVLGTTGTTTAPTTTTTPELIADGVSIGGVDVGGLTPDDAYAAVDASVSSPLVVIVARHRLEPLPAQLGASARIGEAVSRARTAEPGTSIRLAVQVRRPRVNAYVRRVAKRFDTEPVEAKLFLRNLRPWVTKPRAGRVLYQARAQRAMAAGVTTP